MVAEVDRLTDRKEAILQAVVEGYMATARPVGSGLVADQSSLNVSSATVRKELSALEEDGFLHQPHTSAGRVPTDKGYRYFVDSLMEQRPLDAVNDERIADFFARTHGELERILTDTSRLLAGVTDYAAVVVAPRNDASTVRSVQLVDLAPDVVLLVAVMSNGAIERRTLEVAEALTPAQISMAQSVVAGCLIDNDKYPDDPGFDKAVSALVKTALSSFADRNTEERRVHVGGQSAVAGVFDETETVAQVLELFERQFVVVTLLRDLLDRGLRVAIGAESGVQYLNECSLVVAPYEVEGHQVGTIGVLGPTHMNYPQALAAVAAVSNRLGDHLTRG